MNGACYIVTTDPILFNFNFSCDIFTEWCVHIRRKVIDLPQMKQCLKKQKDVLKKEHYLSENHKVNFMTLQQ